MHSQQIFPSGLPSPDAGELKPLNSPPREDRIAAIRLTAAQLKQRLEKEAFRLGLNLQTTGAGKTDDRLPSASATPTREYAVFKGTLPGIELACSKAWFPDDRNAGKNSSTTIAMIAAIVWETYALRSQRWKHFCPCQCCNREVHRLAILEIAAILWKLLIARILLLLRSYGNQLRII